MTKTTTKKSIPMSVLRAAGLLCALACVQTCAGATIATSRDAETSTPGTGGEEFHSAPIMGPGTSIIRGSGGGTGTSGSGGKSGTGGQIVGTGGNGTGGVSSIQGTGGMREDAGTPAGPKAGADAIPAIDSTQVDAVDVTPINECTDDPPGNCDLQKRDMRTCVSWQSAGYCESTASNHREYTIANCSTGVAIKVVDGRQFCQRTCHYAYIFELCHL